MTAAAPPALDFTVPATLEAHAPPEARGLGRDGVRLLAGYRGTGEVRHHTFTDLPGLLQPGDVLVVNTSGTLPAAVDTADGLVVHLSTELPDGRWVVELRRPAGGATEPYPDGRLGQRYTLAGGARLTLLAEYSPGRLWVARIDTALPVPEYLLRHGRPIRYGYVDADWPLESYQTVFAARPAAGPGTGRASGSGSAERASGSGSAEMPSAGRPFTEALVTRLVSAGVLVAPLRLHTGVASIEAHEPPYPERFAVPPTTARLVNQARAAGGRIIAVGTTAVRALESATGTDGVVRAAAGWTGLVVTPERGVRAVDGLLTGFHEPRASHLLMLEAIAGPELLARCYAEAIAGRYLWHEFGDVNLLMP